MEYLSSLFMHGGAWEVCASSRWCHPLATLLCSPLLWFLQFQSCCTLIGIGLAWLWASQSRARESRRIRAAQRAGNPLAFVSTDVATMSHEKQRQLPKVSVVLAVKGAGEQSLANWRSQLVTLYGGPLQYIFCVESKEDPAYDAVRGLQKEMQGISSVRLVVAGLANSCSQQIHNQLAGAKAADEKSKYLLFLDDDIQCHPGTIGALVDSMEHRPEVFVCTGYSFDVPSTPSLAAYAAMAYRLPLLVGMSSGGRAFFVWGGCIMLRMDDLRKDRHGVQTALKKNGYSNDLILTSVAGLNRRVVWCPAVALFPGRMSGNWTFTRYWNYVRRQIFALLTYCSGYAYRTNRLGWVCYSYLAFAVVLPLIPSILHAAFSIVSALEAVLSGASLAAPVVAASGGGVSSALSAVLSWASAAAVAHSLSPVGLVLAWVNLACLVFASLMCIRLFCAAVTLCNLLSPEKKPISLSSISIPLGVAGMLLNLTLLPVIAMYTYLRGDITWAGIRYVRRNGVVAKVQHPQQQQLQLQESQALLKFVADGAKEGGEEYRVKGEGELDDVVDCTACGSLKDVELGDLDADLLGEDYWESPEQNLMGSVLGKATLGYFEAWLKSMPLLGRAISPRWKKLG